jgi:hypothetical protein
VQKVFLNSNSYGCNFHFGQAIWRKIQKLNLATLYLNDKLFKKIIKSFINLAYVPIFEVVKTFNILKNAYYNLGYDLKDFFTYFYKTYIGNEEKRPLFDLKFLNCFDRTMQNVARTTNCLEAWNRNLNFKCNIPHVNTGKFIEVLKYEIEKIRIEFVQAKNSINIKNIDTEKEFKLKIICKNFSFYDDIYEYFDRLEKETTYIFE